VKKEKPLGVEAGEFEKIIPEEAIRDTVIAEGMKMEIMASRDMLENQIKQLRERIAQLSAENEALRLELAQALSMAAEYKRMLKFENAMSSEVLADFLALLDKYKALTFATISESTRLADLSTRYAHAVRFGLTVESIIDELASKLANAKSTEDIEAALGLVKKAKKLLSDTEVKVVPIQQTQQAKQSE